MKKNCKIDQCGRVERARRLCSKHHRQLEAKPCIVAGCESGQIAKGKCPKHYAAEKTAAGTRKRYQFTCTVCNMSGESYNAKATRHAYCQRISTVNKGRKLSTCRELVLVARPVPQPNVTLVAGSWFQAGPCKTCGENFTSSHRDWYCSKDCAKVRKWEKLRSSLRLAVYERDKGICQLCAKPVVEEAWQQELWQPLYPTLDHIIPRSKGGEHTLQNLQLAHAICNSYKRDLDASTRMGEESAAWQKQVDQLEGQQSR
jgi:5-methylcytosine-specific restriction endonuclease McrA